MKLYQLMPYAPIKRLRLVTTLLLMVIVTIPLWAKEPLFINASPYSCPIISATLTGQPVCKGQSPLLTFTATNGQPPYKITYTNGIKTFTQNNIINGASFFVPETIDVNTYYSLVSIEDANGCITNLSTSVTGNNLIVNGDFSLGNTGFSTSYIYDVINRDEGEYFVGTNARDWNSSVFSCHDHTSGNGNMLLVNGAPTLNENVWKQTIPVQPNTNYVFSSWIESISEMNPAKLQFSINNIQLGDIFQASSEACKWQQFYTTWNSGNNTTATISLVNQNNIRIGNDFALDDISFAEIIPTNEKTLVSVKECIIPVASFAAPDSVCVNTPVSIANTSKQASSFYWNFSVADINKTPIGENIGNPGGKLSSPVFIDIVSDNGMYYGFQTNCNPGKLLRYDFGNSMLNTPIVTDLGDFGVLPQSGCTEGIQVVKDNGAWYAFIVGGSALTGNSARIIKIELGTNIANNSPIATNWGNIGNLDQPLDLNVFEENGKWYGFTVNADNNTATRFDFGYDFTNPPVATNLGSFNGLLSYPTGINAIKENGQWYVFITNTTSSKITRLDFGSSLNNIPTALDIGNPSNVLNQPRDILILRFCGQLIGFVVNGKDLYRPSSNDLTKIDFNNLITNIPTGISMGNIANFDFPHSLSRLFREGADLYSFIPNVQNNTLSRLKFTGGTDLNIANSSQEIPPVITYSKPGIYNINLLIDEGLPTQASFCKSITVLPVPQVIPVLDTFLCRGDSIKLKANVPYGKYLWNTGSADAAIFVKTAGMYSVAYDYYGCKGKDDFTTTIKELPIVNLGGNTGICKNDSLLLDAGNTGVKYLWQDGTANKTIWAKQAGNYIVSVTDANNCMGKDTAKITVYQLPTITLTKNTTICTGNTVQINAISPNATKFEWNTSPGLSAIDISNPVANPTDTTKYYLKVTDNNNCSNKDSVTVFVVAAPTISVMKDTAICTGSSVGLNNQSNAVTKYEWSPANTLDNANAAVPVASPKTKTQYVVKATNDGCFTSNQVTIDVLPLPFILKSNDTTICIPGSASLNVSGGVAYNWYPAKGLSNISISNPVATAGETIFYKAKVTDANGCSNIDSILVKVLPKPVFTVEPANPALCINDSLSIAAKGGDIYKWEPVKDILNPDNSKVTVYPDATTDYKVTITNMACNVTDAVAVHVQVNPLPGITMRKSNDIDCLNPTTRISASGGIQYNWWPAAYLNSATAISPVASVLEDTRFYVKVTDRNSCSNIDSIMVNVTHNGEPMFVVPNAFSPNGDGQNDCFGVKYWGTNNKLIEFSVYNRWGVKVFSTTNINDCWDGTYKGVLQSSGGFVYVIRAKTICGDIERKGIVMLVR